MSKKDDKNLIGFKDFLDYQEEKLPKIVKRNQPSNYELYSFLERESERLSRLLKMFEEKAFVMKNYPQDTKIIIDTESDIIEKRIEVISKLSSKESSLNKNLQSILNAHFKS